jgi:pimeloyl-ACP methyl ester carboxylesterase
VIHTVVDGVHLHAEVEGIGDPPLVLVHGWCSNLRHWDAVTAHLAARHRVLTVDRRGHGASDAPDPSEVEYSATRHAADLDEVMAAVGMDGAVVVGHAGGVPGVLALAVAHPRRVRALVLVDAIVSPASRIGDPADPAGAALGAMIDRILGDGGDPAFREIYATFFGPDAGAVADDAVADAARVPRSVAVAELRSLAVDTVGLARAVDVPVLWLTAAAADEDALTSVFRAVQFGRVVGSGHFPHLEVPAQVNAMIDRFVETL